MVTAEESFFFTDKNNHFLYGCTYFPQKGMGNLGVLVVPPVGHDRLRCLHECVSLSRFLAGSGFPVMRFDYRGEGESSGEFCDFDIESRLEDISTSIREHRNRFSVKDIVLIGFRLGAVLALLAANQNSIQNLILCEPVYDVNDYVKSCMRSNVLAQRDYFGKVSQSEEMLWSVLEKGDSISIQGFQASMSFFSQLGDIDIGKQAALFSGKSSIVNFYRGKTPTVPQKTVALLDSLGGDTRCSVDMVHVRFSWGTKKFWTPVLPELNKCVARLLSGVQYVQK